MLDISVELAEIFGFLDVNNDSPQPKHAVFTEKTLIWMLRLAVCVLAHKITQHVSEPRLSCTLQTVDKH